MLLKCIGRIILLIETGVAPFNELHYSGKYQSGFSVVCDVDGALRISNIRFSYREIPLVFRTTLNSKTNYPVHCWYKEVEIPVLTEDGEPDPEFEKFLTSL